MKSSRLKFFIDFDGTVTRNDIWVHTLRKFASDKDEFDRISKEYHSGNLDGRETIKRHLDLIKHFSFDKFHKYLDEEEIDKHFSEFIDFCNERGYEVNIVSGGMDHYINYILNRHSIDVKIYSCHMKYDEVSQKISCELIHTDEYCKLCETCKRNILISRTNDLENEISVFIGDSDSDFCVSGYADMVFAKGRLASHCWKNNITYFDYHDFSDIKKKIIKLTEKPVRQRQEAKVRRRDVMMGG